VGAPPLGELGIARAYVAGDLYIERGTIFDVLELRHARPDLRLRPADLLAAARLLDLHRPAGWRLRLPAPPEEARPHGRRHSKRRDAVAVTRHYDVSNAFYDIVLGPSMTYSCAVWERSGVTLDQAQTAKYELVARKFALRPGMRLLDVGCGGGMALHAASRYGVHTVGITLSEPQASYDHPGRPLAARCVLRRHAEGGGDIAGWDRPRVAHR